MATTKTKGTNAKIKELKGVKPEKIEEKELTHLQTIIRNIDRLTADIGRMETQKYAMLVAMQKVQEEINTKRVEFMDKYGSDNINIQTGAIAYPEETLKAEENGEVNS
tara:strand:- start:247 stop:570 length:324 start_codon:yes stop_codon:yes gene_type:complete